MAKSANKGRLVAFHVDPVMFDQLEAKAKSFGFQSAALYARAIVEKNHGTGDLDLVMERIGAAQLKLQKKALKIIAATLANLTEEDFLSD